MNQNIRYAVDGDGIAQLVIDVPGRPMNVMTPEFLRELGECVARIAGDAGVRGAVLSSAKASFMAGADIKDMVGMFDRGVSAQQATEFSTMLTTHYRRLETCGKPVAAAINGVALGGGYELALACHYRVLADDAKAGVGLPEVKIGLLPGAGGTQRLPRLLGVVEALKLLTDGRQVGAQEALKKGMVHEIAPAAEIVERARQWIRAFACRVVPECHRQPSHRLSWPALRSPRGRRCATIRRRWRFCRASTRARSCRSTRRCAWSPSILASCSRDRSRAT